MRRPSIRWRLTLWYGAVLAAALGGFGGTVYAMMRHGILGRIDEALGQDLAEIEEELEEASSPERLRQRLERRFAHHQGQEYQVSRLGGEVVCRSQRLRPHRLPIPPVPGSLRHLDFESASLGSAIVGFGDSGRWRVATRLTSGPHGSLVIQAATSLAPMDHELDELIAVLVLAGPLALACALGGGYLLARKALAPVDRMAATADQITALRLDRRLEVANPDDELGRLARTLNGMMVRLERSFEEIRRFTADAAHELRTPLAVLRNAAEVALRAPREPEHYRQVLQDMLEEIERLTRLAEQLLFLCREDAGLTTPAGGPVRLDELVHGVAEHMRLVAAEKEQTLEVEVSTQDPVSGDPEHLRRLLYNLLDNAIKYTPPGGKVVVRGHRTDVGIRLVVSDTGVGIPPEHLPRVFDRFYRVDPSRGRETDGTGLGLAICRSIAASHGGRIEVRSAVGRGTEVIVILPRSE